MTDDLLREAHDAYRRRDYAHHVFVRALLAARDAGCGYGAIAQALALPRSTVQSMINRYRKETG